MRLIAKIIDDNTIEVYDLAQFDMDAIMHSGQVFRYFDIEGGGYDLVVGDNFCVLKNDGDRVIIKCNDAKYFFEYFDLGRDYGVVKKIMDENICFAPIIKDSGGIRILKGEFVEMVISFIVSANNNIKRFKKTLNLLAEEFGRRLANGRYSFPDLAGLQKVKESDFNRMGCGYRSPYLVKTIERLKDMDYFYLKTLSNEQLMMELMQLYGVGKKVASCIMLFCFHRLDVAPVDTWINKAIEGLGEDKHFLINHKYAGIYQQYIFHYMQHLKKEI